jgi:hypothetical protein
MPTTLRLHSATLVRKAEYRLSYAIIGAHRLLEGRTTMGKVVLQPWVDP